MRATKKSQLEQSAAAMTQDPCQTGRRLDAYSRCPAEVPEIKPLVLR